MKDYTKPSLKEASVEIAFIKTLVPEGYVDFRALRKGGIPIKKLVNVNNETELTDLLNRYRASRNVYMGVAARVDPLKDGDKSNCGHLHALFGEWDKPWEQVVLNGMPQPSILIDSGGGGCHGYWLLDEPLALHNGHAGDAEELLKKLAAKVGFERESAEIARVLRIPNTFNHKYGEPRSVLVRKFRPDEVHELDYLKSLVDGVELPKKKSKPLAPEVGEGSRNDNLFREGCRLRRLGWSREEIQGALETVNRQRCKPPLPTSEIEELAKSCSRYEREEDTYPQTETGDAEYFVSCNYEQISYDHLRQRWLIFDDVRWCPENTGQMMRLAIESSRGRQRAAIEGTNQQKSWAASGESRKRLTNMLAIAKNLELLADDGRKWDRDPWLLGVPNGVVDLRTGELRPGRLQDRITMQTRFPYEPDAECPLWDQTLEQIFAGNKEMIGFFDRFVGYSVTGDCREEVLAFCWGGGANGKGTTMNTIAWILGDYAGNLPFSTLELQDRSSIPNDLAKIDGKRFVTASESSEVGRFNEARIKSLTGRDPIDARFLHKEWFTFIPTFKLWLAANRKPVTRDTSKAFWRRIELIPFTQSFEGREDTQLKDKLLKEGPGILARAVRGCLEWQQKEGLNPPRDVAEATEQYRLESLPLSPFVAECCIKGSKFETTFTPLFKRYNQWYSRGYQSTRRLNRTEFIEALRQMFEVKDQGPKRGTIYLGVGLLADDEEDEGI